MKNVSLGRFAFAVFFGFMIAVAGCGKGVASKSGPDQCMEDMIAGMNNLADAVEAGKSNSQVEQLQAAYERARKKFADLPSKDQTMPSTKYMLQLQTAQKRMANAVIRHSIQKMKTMQPLH